MNQRELLIYIGETLFGTPWHARLANALSINRRTLQRWINSDDPAPRHVWDELDGMLLRHISAAEHAHRQIVKQTWRKDEAA